MYWLADLFCESANLVLELAKLGCTQLHFCQFADLVFVFAIILKIKEFVEDGGGGWDEVSVTLLVLAPEELVGFLGQAQVVMYLGI